jgi:transitional endoplasmic reticulum ATPase
VAEDVDLVRLVGLTEGYTGADLAAVCNEAVMLAIRDFVAEHPKAEKAKAKGYKLRQEHFERALQKVRPLPPETLKEFREIHERMQLNR